jgi:chromatin segregation and condensation protein Rec8/ScpA/Scc1 (kleisin family)
VLKSRGNFFRYFNYALKEKENISKEYIVTLFLAILELSNNKGMKIYQENIYGDIIITKQERK